MIWMPQIFPCVCAELQQNDLAKHGREEAVVTPQQHRRGGVTVRVALSLLHVQPRQGTQLLTPMRVSLCRQPFNLQQDWCL